VYRDGAVEGAEKMKVKRNGKGGRQGRTRVLLAVKTRHRKRRTIKAAAINSDLLVKSSWLHHALS